MFIHSFMCCDVCLRNGCRVSFVQVLLESIALVKHGQVQAACGHGAVDSCRTLQYKWLQLMVG